MKLIYNISTRTFTAGKAKSTGNTLMNKVTSTGKSWLSNNATSKYNRSNTAFNIGKAIDSFNQNKELKAQILGGRGKRTWNPKTWLRGKKINGLVNDAGEMATAVTGNQKYKQAANTASNLGKTATQIGSDAFQRSTGMTHTSEGNLLIKDRKKAIEYGQKMDALKKVGVGNKNGTWQSNLVRNEALKSINSNNIVISDAAKKKLDKTNTWKGENISNTFDTNNVVKRKWYNPRRYFNGKYYQDGLTADLSHVKANAGKQLDVVNGRFVYNELPSN